MKNKIIFCTGGARSGKSEYAEALVLAKSGTKGYVATGQAYDEEMRHRIDVHKARRKENWNNYEVPFDLHLHIGKILSECDVVLVDCLTMWTTNLLLLEELESQEVINGRENQILEFLNILIDEIKKTEGATEKTVVFVTNEIGWGIVPENKLSRVFRDIMGKVNQKVATTADEAYMTISGITINLKAQEVTVHG